MKKLISLSAVVLIAAMAFAQDTIPTVVKKSKDTIPALAKKNISAPKGLDTMPKGNKDTVLLSKANKMPDTSMTRNIPDTMPGTRELASANSQSDSASVTKKIVTDRVIMKDEKVLVVKNGDSTLLKDSIVLESGAVVMKDGTVTYTSGKTVKLKNGQYIPFSKAAESNSQADSASATKTTTDDKVVVKDDKVIVVKKGDSTLLTDSIKLKSGAIVKKDASVKFKDGTTTKLKNGQSITLKPVAVETNSKTDTPSATATKTIVEDKVVMMDENVMVIKNGDSTLLEDSIKLKSGAVVMKDGSVRFKDGTTTKLKKGQFIAMNPPAVPVERKKTKTTTTKKTITPTKTTTTTTKTTTSKKKE